MAMTIGQGVTLKGLIAEDFSYTWNISGTNGVNPMTSIPVGVYVAMSQDTAANNTAKVANSLNALIIGALRSYENRVQEGIVTGAIAHKGVFTFAYTGTAPTRGQSVAASATAGKVVAVTNTGANNLVVEVDTTAQTVTVKFD